MSIADTTDSVQIVEIYILHFVKIKYTGCKLQSYITIWTAIHKQMFSTLICTNLQRFPLVAIVYTTTKYFTIRSEILLPTKKGSTKY